MKKNILSNEKGFALLAALMACLILIAIGILVINMSTGDMITSSATVGYKKALLAVESGVPKVVNDVQPTNWNTANGYSVDSILPAPPLTCGSDAYDQYDRIHHNLYIWQPIPGGTDAHTEFAICRPTVSIQPPIPAQGYELGGGGASGGYGIQRYDSTIVGHNTSYNSQSKVDIGVGFGPVVLSE